MTLTDYDKNLLARVFAHAPGAWRDFVDRFGGVVTHVVNHFETTWSIPVTPKMHAETFREVFRTLRDDDFRLLRRHDGNSSLATYLAVTSYRVAGSKLSAFRPRSDE